MDLTLYVSPHCQCTRPDLDALDALAAELSGVRFRIVDVTQALEEAATAGVRRTPTLVLDGEPLPVSLIRDTGALRKRILDQRAATL